MFNCWYCVRRIFDLARIQWYLVFRFGAQDRSALEKRGKKKNTANFFEASSGRQLRIAGIMNRAKYRKALKKKKILVCKGQQTRVEKEIADH